MFLNPDLSDIVKLARTYNVLLTAENGVNANYLPDALAEDLVRYRFGSISCSINGASNVTYARYHVGGNFETVIEHCRTIQWYKQKYRSPFPRMQWQYIVFGYNEHEIEKARSLAVQLGMSFLLRLNVSHTYEPLVDSASVSRYVWGKIASRKAYYQRVGSPFWAKRVCSLLWNSPQINWDGRVFGCCLNYWGDFGSVAENSLEAVLSSPLIQRTRRMLLGEQEEAPESLCSTCLYYRLMKRQSQWLRPSEIYWYRYLAQLKYACLKTWGNYPLPRRYCI